MLASSNFSRISSKIILLVLSLELVSLGIWGALTYQGSERELLNTISSKLSESASRTATEIGNFFDPLTAEVLAITKLLAVLPDNSHEQKRLFQLLFNSRPEIEEISFVGAQGREKIRISRLRGLGPGDLRDLSASQLLRQARRHQGSDNWSHEASEISLSQFSEPQIEMAFPLPEGEEFILMKVNLKWLWDKVQDQEIGKFGYAYVLNEELTLIAHQDPSLVLKGLNLSNTHVPDELFNDSNTGLSIYPNFSGQSVTGVSYFDHAHNWWVVVEQPVAEGLAPLRRVIDQFLIAFILVALSTVVILIYFVRKTLRPLEKLEQGIARLSSGDRSVQIEVSGSSELSSLARSFNSMAASIDRHSQKMLKVQNRLESSRKELQASDGQVRMLLNSTIEAIYGVDMAGVCIFCNQAALDYLDISSVDDVIGKPADRFIRLLPDETESNIDAIQHIHNPALIGEGIYFEHLLIPRLDGEFLHIELRSHPIVENGNLVGAVVTFTDINERHIYQEVLIHQANHDSLTGLPNRKLLHERLDELLEAKAPINPFALLFIDLDRFKEINDSLGHKIGDDLLKQLGPRLQALLGKEDLLARLGGDEFAIILRSRNSSDEVTDLVTEILDAITRPFDLDGMQIQVDASIGISKSPEHGNDGSTLMRFADVAMYDAKSQALGYAIYDPSLDAHSPRRLALTVELRNAIDDDQMTLYYQPKIRLKDEKIVGFEALVRWNHPEYGLLMPDQFIPLAELGDLINPLTLWVVDRALSDRQQWSEQGWDFDVAVNVSVRNLQNPELVDKINQCLVERNLLASHLEMEITESSIMTDTVKAENTLESLFDHGIRFAIDDYGTGHSSLAYLKKLPVDYLKIDKSFILEVADKANDALIVRSTIELAHNLGLKVIAEGVENQASWDLLSKLRCDYAQGYFISKPMPLEEVIPWSVTWSRKSKYALAQ